MSENLVGTDQMVEPRIDDATAVTEAASTDTGSADRGEAERVTSASSDADVIDVAGPAAAYSGYADDALPDVDPGRKLGMIGIIAAILGPVGIALGFVAFRKSRAVGYGGTRGTVAMVAGTIVTILLAAYFIMMATGMGFGGACEGRGPGLHTLDDGTRISCS